MSFGLLCYRTSNLGDEIQSVAAERFLPRVDRLLDRDKLDIDPAGAAPVSVILNGWFMSRPFRWPPHPRIRPLLISVHLDMRRQSRLRFWRRRAASHLLMRPGRDWFLRHGPVGARDLATQALLTRHGIPAYHSGCLTLTLPPSEAAREAVIVACDLADPLVAELRGRSRLPVVTVSHYEPALLGHEARMAEARRLLDLYGRARAVVTSRLHCALPCLALGTPVLLVTTGREVQRMQPGIDLARATTPAAFLAGTDGFDPDAPPANGEEWRTFVPELVRRCEAFVASDLGDRVGT